MKEYCVDLEIAKELKKNGFIQKRDAYYWINSYYAGSPKQDDTINYLKYNPIAEQYEIENYLAPIAEELIKELPREIKDLNFEYFYHLKIEQSPIHDERFLISYGITDLDRASMEKYHTEDKKLSNALAVMWLKLKKEGYIHEIQRR